MLEVEQLSHHYGKTQVLFDLNFSVNTGEIVGLLGPNGAGKSTTMRILTGYLSPSGGAVRFDGKDIRENPQALRRHLGYMPENVPLYPELKVREYLLWAARVKKSAKPAAESRDVMERCGLDDMADRLIRHLSRGYRQRVGLAQAILGPTRLLILDEPTVGLDPRQIRDIRTLIQELGREKTILLSTHILPEVELTCDRALIISKGRIIVEDTPAGLTQAFGGRGKYLLRLDIPPSDTRTVLEHFGKLPWVRSASMASGDLALSGEGAYIIETDPEQEERARITAAAFEAGWPILEFKPARVSLEEVYVSLVHEETMAGEEA
jgi:ABC-2 type transport system ATP-binding protein